jgi:hypothetical protein
MLPPQGNIRSLEKAKEEVCEYIMNIYNLLFCLDVSPITLE